MDDREVHPHEWILSQIWGVSDWSSQLAGGSRRASDLCGSSHEDTYRECLSVKELRRPDLGTIDKECRSHLHESVGPAALYSLYVWIIVWSSSPLASCSLSIACFNPIKLMGSDIFRASCSTLTQAIIVQVIWLTKRRLKRTLSSILQVRAHSKLCWLGGIQSPQLIEPEVQDVLQRQPDGILHWLLAWNY